MNDNNNSGILDRISKALGVGEPYTRDCRRTIAAMHKRIGKMENPDGCIRIHPAIPLPDNAWDHGTAIIGNPGSGKTMILADIADSIIEAGKPLLIIEENDFFHKRYDGMCNALVLPELSGGALERTIAIDRFIESIQKISGIIESMQQSPEGRPMIIRLPAKASRLILSMLVAGICEHLKAGTHIVVEGASCISPDAIRELMEIGPTIFTLQAGVAVSKPWDEFLHGGVIRNGSAVFCQGSDMILEDVFAGAEAAKAVKVRLGTCRGRVDAYLHLGGSMWKGALLEWPFSGCSGPSRGRPRKNDSLRDGALTVGLTKEERGALEAAAAKAGTTPSALARKAIAAHIG